VEQRSGAAVRPSVRVGGGRGLTTREAILKPALRISAGALTWLFSPPPPPHYDCVTTEAANASELSRYPAVNMTRP
jgi:hypothetical protein